MENVATNATSLPNFTTADTSLSNSTANAQKQYSILQESPILRDAQVNSKFKALKDRWAAYMTFVQNTSDDYKTLGPLLVELNNSQQSAMTASQHTNGNLIVELAQYQALVTETSQQANSLNMLTNPDQQMLSSLKTYVKSSNLGIAQAQSDVSAGKGLSMVTADLASLASSATTFSNAQNSLTSASSAELQNLDPSTQINAFINAINGLSSRINQQPAPAVSQ
jgi:LytS/YehU family sensor histidine kinase